MIAVLFAMLAAAPQMPTVVDCRSDGGIIEAICATFALKAERFAVVDGTCRNSGAHVPVVLWIDTNRRLHVEPQWSCE